MTTAQQAIIKHLFLGDIHRTLIPIKKLTEFSCPIKKRRFQLNFSL